MSLLLQNCRNILFKCHINRKNQRGALEKHNSYMCFLISDLASKSGECHVLNGKISSCVFLCISSLLEKVVQVLSWKQIPSHCTYYCSWTHHFCPGSMKHQKVSPVIGSKTLHLGTRFPLCPLEEVIVQLQTHLCQPSCWNSETLKQQLHSAAENIIFFPDGNIWPSLIIITDYASL